MEWSGLPTWSERKIRSASAHASSLLPTPSMPLPPIESIDLVDRTRTHSTKYLNSVAFNSIRQSSTPSARIDPTDWERLRSQCLVQPLNRSVAIHTMQTTDFREPAPKLTELLQLLINLNGSDLHITINTPPRVRVNGDLCELSDYPILTAEDTKTYAYSVMSHTQKADFEDRHQIDLSFGIQGLSRFRVNVFDQRNGIGIVFRAIPFDVVPADKLNLPGPLVELCDRPNGLVLITGPTGSGKSTTLAALLDKINRERPVHILTIEDPIEFIHGHKKGCVNQREVGPNTRKLSRCTSRRACDKIRTSFSSAKCATSKLSSRHFASLKPAI